MSWAKQAIEKLLLGETVQIRPRGHSMKPKVKSGQLVTLSPDLGKVSKGDIVLCRVKGKDYLHLVKAVSSLGRYQIGNNRGGINGWIGASSIFGIVTEVA